MNKHIYIVLGSFLGTLLSLSCTDKVPVQLDIQGADGYVQIYMPSASRLDNSKSVYIQEEKQTFNVSAYYGGPKYPSQDLFIEFEFRPDLVADYNAKNGTDYAAMPEGSYAMPVSVSKLAKGELQSEPLTVELVTANNIEVAKTYLLPISIKNSSGTEPINESLRTTYYLITGSYQPGSVPCEKVYSFGKALANPICICNTDMVYMNEENNLAYIKLNDDGTYGTPTVFAYGWAGCTWLAYMPEYLVARYNGNINCYNINDSYVIGSQSSPGQGWEGFKQLVLFKDLGILAVSGDALNKYPFVSGGITFDFPNCGTFVSSGWGNYNYIFSYKDHIIAVDSAGDMWAFSLSDSFVLGAPRKIGTGWDMYTSVMACGDELLAIDSAGDVWRYEFNLAAFWPLNKEEETLQKVPLADPYILLHEGVYYAYGTAAANGIEVWVSEDLQTWVKGNGHAAEGLALHKDDVWGEQWFWAPEVYALNGKFYMYYSAEEHICAAVASSPLGPFVQEKQEPLIADEKCIDNTLFIDEDKKAYMFFDRFNDGLNIWMAEMQDDLLSLKTETMRACIHVSQEWEEVWPRVNEGSFVIRDKDKYYMIYSANSYESPYYGIGYATATSLSGSWEKYPNNPILQMPNGLVGVGHGALLRDKDGVLRIVFHAHKNETSINPREMYISTVHIENGVMSIDENYMIPHQ